MHVSLFKALKSIKITDESATGVVEDMQRYVESVLTYNIQAVQGDLAALRGEVRGDLAALRGEMRGELAAVRGELKGLAAGMEALKHQVTLMGVLIGIVGLAIAAGPIVAKFIR